MYPYSLSMNDKKNVATYAHSSAHTLYSRGNSSVNYFQFLPSFYYCYYVQGTSYYTLHVFCCCLHTTIRTFQQVIFFPGINRGAHTCSHSYYSYSTITGFNSPNNLCICTAIGEKRKTFLRPILGKYHECQICIYL